MSEGGRRSVVCPLCWWRAVKCGQPEMVGGNLNSVLAKRSLGISVRMTELRVRCGGMNQNWSQTVATVVEMPDLHFGGILRKTD
jgi:hypothetical protein